MKPSSGFHPVTWERVSHCVVKVLLSCKDEEKQKWRKESRQTEKTQNETAIGNMANAFFFFIVDTHFSSGKRQMFMF